MRPTLLSGLDLLAPSLPTGWRSLDVPDPPPGRLDFIAELRRALENPVSSKPLRERAKGCQRIVLLLEDLSGLAGIPSEPVVTELIVSVLQVLREAGAARSSVTLTWGTGLGAKPTRPLLDSVVDPAHVGGGLLLHDAEDLGGFAVAELGGHPFDLDRRILEADLVVMLSVRQLPTATPLASLLEAVSSYRSLRPLHDPAMSNEAREVETWRRIQGLAQRVPLFGVFVGLDAKLLSPALELLFRSGDGLGRAERGWNRLPEAVRARMLAAWRSPSRPMVVAAGDVQQASAQRETALGTSRTIELEAAFDALLVAVPEVPPFTGFRRSNPVLSAHLGLVTLGSPARPALAADGVVVLCSPLLSSGWNVDLPYLDFMERVLPSTRDPSELFARFEGASAGRPEYVAAYRRRGALHGSHPFHRWYELHAAKVGLRRVIAAGVRAETAHRLGLEHAATVAAALDSLQAELGREPRVGVVGWPAPLVKARS